MAARRPRRAVPRLPAERRANCATLTRVTERADREGWLVLLPRQSDAGESLALLELVRGATPSAARGEAAIVAAQIVARPPALPRTA